MTSAMETAMTNCPHNWKNCDMQEGESVMVEEKDLIPCRYCGGGETRFRDTGNWTGMRMQFICTNLMHFCESEGLNNFNRVTYNIRAQTREVAADIWKRLNQ